MEALEKPAHPRGEAQKFIQLLLMSLLWMKKGRRKRENEKLGRSGYLLLKNIVISNAMDYVYSKQDQTNLKI